MNPQYYCILFLVLLILLILISRNNREYFNINKLNYFSKRDIFKKNNLNPNKLPWLWFDSNIAEENKKISTCFNNDYLKGLNKKMDKIVDILIDKTIKLSIVGTTPSIHNLIPVGCLLSRFMLSYIRQKKPDMIYHILSKIGYKPGSICTQKQKFTANYIYGVLQLGLNFKVEPLDKCPCLTTDISEEYTVPLNIDLIIKMICYPIRLNKQYKKDLPHIYNICVFILASYIINKNKKIDLTKYGILLDKPIIYLQVMWDLITNSYSKEICFIKRDLLFSYYLKNVSVSDWLTDIDIDKLSSMFVIAGIPFIQNHMNFIKKFPFGLLDMIKTKLENSYNGISNSSYNKSSKNSYNEISNSSYIESFIDKGHINVTSRNNNYDLSHLAECSDLHYLENDEDKNYKQDFLNNMFNFENCDSENEIEFIKYIYYYSRYLHHLKKEEVIDLFNKELNQLNLTCKDKDNLCTLYNDSQNIIDGKESIDNIFNSV